MEDNFSWETNSRLANNQGIFCILWNPMFDYHAHKSPPPVPPSVIMTFQ